MSIKKVDDKYLVDIRPRGRAGKRIRKKFTTKREALEFERYCMAHFHDKAWLDKPDDKRDLKNLIELWFDCYGQTLKEGPNVRSRLHNIAKATGNPKACDINPGWFAHYRTRRLKDGLAVKTLNNELVMLSGVFTQLIENGFFYHEHPLKGVKKLKLKQREMTYLSDEQIDKLLQLVKGNPDLSTIVKICLSTGARWGEAEGLVRAQVLEDRIILDKTKTGKTRTLPINAELRDEILKGKEDGPLFQKCYSELRSILQKHFDLPKGQSSHILRHTFASQFMIRGGNILTLQRALGHSTITQTMEYAHLSPDHLKDVLMYNPLANRVHK